MPSPGVRLDSVTPAAHSRGQGSTFFPFPPAVYPYEMLRAGIGGEVVVRVEVGTDGRVRRSQVIASSQREFAEPAEHAATQWRFLEFATPGSIVRSPMILDCRIIFEPLYDSEPFSPTFWGVMGTFQSPNKSPEPTTTSGTSAAEQPLVPAAVVAHL